MRTYLNLSVVVALLSPLVVAILCRLTMEPAWASDESSSATEIPDKRMIIGSVVMESGGVVTKSHLRIDVKSTVTGEYCIYVTDTEDVRLKFTFFLSVALQAVSHEPSSASTIRVMDLQSKAAFPFFCTDREEGTWHYTSVAAVFVTDRLGNSVSAPFVMSLTYHAHPEDISAWYPLAKCGFAQVEADGSVDRQCSSGGLEEVRPQLTEAGEVPVIGEYRFVSDWGPSRILFGSLLDAGVPGQGVGVVLNGGTTAEGDLLVRLSKPYSGSSPVGGEGFAAPFSVIDCQSGFEHIQGPSPSHTTTTVMVASNGKITGGITHDIATAAGSPFITVSRRGIGRYCFGLTQTIVTEGGAFTNRTLSAESTASFATLLTEGFQRVGAIEPSYTRVGRGALIGCRKRGQASLLIFNNVGQLTDSTFYLLVAIP